MRIFSGIQPTGRKHLGNYIGAIAQYVSGQDRGEGIYCIVDLHALTVSYEPAELRERFYDTTAILLAAGLDPARCILFRQSDVREHTELTWLLSSVTELGRLERMHQFRDKSVAQRELVELMLAFPRRFNSRFAGDQEVLVVPELRIPSVGARIMDLQDPTRKMSTTGGSEQGTIYVLDEPKAVEKKLKSAVTDSGSDVRRDAEKPGVSNLIEILAAVRGVGPDAIEAELSDARYGELKAAVAAGVVEYLAPVRERYAELRADEDAIEAILADGAARASAIAAATLADVRERMGVGAPRRDRSIP
jgi:tryptophanyl-tRNA synthetase